MKISIITPNNNGGIYIENCIISVLKQNVDFEHIIVDCKSTYSSNEIFKKYPHLKIISESDNGMYDAINKGIALAKGDIISYLNCDDRYPNNSLKIVEQLFSKYSFDFVYGDCKLISDSEKDIYIYRVPPISRELLKQITVVPWAQPSIFFRRYIFDDIGNFNINYSFASDYEFMKRVIFSEYIGFRCKEVLSKFMIRDDSLGSKYSIEMLDEGARIKKNLKIKNRPILDLLFNIYRKVYNFHTLLKTFNK